MGISPTNPATHGRFTTADTPIDIVVQEELAADVRRAKAEQQQWDDRAFSLSEKYDKAEAKAEATGDPADRLEADKIHHRLMEAIGRGTALGEIIRNMTAPHEHERRVQEKTDNQKSLRRLTERSTRMAKETARDQGVPDAYLGENGNFRIGMDARLKSDLVLSALGEVTKDKPGNSLHVFEPKEALALLEKRNWMGFHDRKKELIETVALKKAENAEKREAAAREKAAEKEKRDAEKKAAKEKADAEKATAAATAAASAPKAGDEPKISSGEAKSDPKPVGAGRSRGK